MSRSRPDRLTAILQAAKNRAKKHKGVRAKFDLDKHLPALKRRFDLKRCEVTGIAFNMTATVRRKWNSPSIDRIDATKGYTFDNVRFVLWAINASLSDWGENVFELIATAWLANKAKKKCEEC